MDNSAKKQSQENISMPKNKKPKKTDLDKALEYYNVKGKNFTAIANAIKFKNPTTSIKRKDGTKDIKKVSPSNEPNSYYANRVRDAVIKKWKSDTQEYYGTYNMFYKVLNTKTKKMVDVVTKLTVKGTKKNIDDNAFDEYENRKKRYMEDYPENDSYSFDEKPVSLIPITSGDGIIVENQRVESSVSGGQRIVGKRGIKRNMKMKEAFSFFKFGDDKQEWNSNKGKCVFDYLIWKYKDMSGFTKVLGKGKEKAEEFLNDLFRDDNIEEQNPITQGVSISQLEKFCDKFSINMYAFDKSDWLIQYYKCNKAVINSFKEKKTGGGLKPPLVFVVYDNHFYPVEDKKERERKTKRAYCDGNGFTSNTIEAFDSKKEVKQLKVIAPSEDEFEDMKKDKPDYLAVQNIWALEYFKQNEGKLPFPIDARNIYVNDATIERILYDDKVILTKPINKYVKWFYDKETEIGFQGESKLSITDYIWELMYPFKFHKADFLSRPNQQVLDALNAEKVKWRTHLGRIQGYIEPETIRDMLKSKEAIAVDITKCYCDAIYNQKDKFIVFKGKEIVEEYDGKPLTLGLYFVETDDMTLLHQSNWYSRTIIELAMKEGININITRQIRCVDEDWNYEKVIEPNDKDFRNWVNRDICNEKYGVYTKGLCNRCNINPDTDEDFCYCCVECLDKINEELYDDYIKQKKTISLDNTNLFKDWCDTVIELTNKDEDFSLTKDVINSITGYLGKTFSKTKEVGLAKNLEELWTDWLIPDTQEFPNVDIYLNTIESNDDKVYLYGTEKMTKNLSNGLPMYIQLLDWSNEALYNLCKEVGGEIVYRKTDCIVSIGGKIPKDKLEKDICCYTERFGKYHQEDIEKALHFNYELVMNEDRKVKTPTLDSDWIDYNEFKTSDDWEAIIKTAKEKGGMYISGRAGTGKTYIIHKGIEANLLPEENETRLAFTNRAARNIRGTTINSVLKINMNGNTNPKTLESLKKYDTFIVDEISMINGEFWNYLMLLKTITKATFILLGDYRQCPPIENGKEMEYFNHPYIKRLVNYNRCELTEPQRYDIKLWNWLEEFYENNYANEDIEKKKLRIDDIIYRKNLCYINKTRRNINNLCMDYFKKTKTFIVLTVPEKCKNEKADMAFIYVELPVMAVVKNSELGIMNSEEFIVKEFSSSESNMTLYREEDPDGELFVIEFKEFHKRFVVNYAATAHKSQGATITKDINIFDWYKMLDNKKIGYTAVSRAKSCEQVTICLDY